MKKFYFIPFVLLFLLYSCSDSSIPTNNEWDSSINGKRLRINQGQKFTLELDVLSDAGFSWDCEFSDSTVILLDSVSYRQKANVENLDGGLTVETFYFSGTKRGICKVNLIEHRSWEVEVPPINNLQFFVTVL